ncbi:MAG TPA: DUF2612 domain-containing protein, partial [Gammaproteobacteria bacterium]|nr:DUF2612 domain-containing protein [Gammaproteobacteria bacterium]
MSEWPIQQIATHEADAKDRLTSQYDDATKLQGLVGLWAGRMQGVEDAAYEVLTERWVDVAVGAQLDGMGEIVGEPRLGRTDTEYRAAIEIRVSLNRSGGEPERIIEFLRRIAGADKVEYREIHPAKIELYVTSDVSFEDAKRVRDLVPAAVGSVYIEESGGELPWGIKEEGDAAPADRDGFGELAPQDLELSDGSSLELSDGTTLQVTDRSDDTLYQYDDGSYGGVL